MSDMIAYFIYSQELYDYEKIDFMPDGNDVCAEPFGTECV